MAMSFLGKGLVELRRSRKGKEVSRELLNKLRLQTKKVH